MKIIGIVERFRFLFLFIVLIAFFLFKAISKEFQHENLGSFIFIFLIIYSLYVIGHKKRFLILTLSFIALAEIIFFIANAWVNLHILLIMKVIFAILFFSMMTYACILFMLMDKSICVTTLFGALCSYLFIGLSWAYIYLLLVLINPDAFHGLSYLQNGRQDNEFIYYSFVTLTTIGFGDIYPTEELAKTLTWLEAYTGQIFLTVVIAMLVGRYILGQQNQ